MPTDPKIIEEFMGSVRNNSIFLVTASIGMVNIDVQDSHGYTALAHAAEKGHTKLVQLLQNGASTSIRSYSITQNHSENGHFYFSTGCAPIHRAAARGYLEIVELLLRYGANPNLRSTAGRSPLRDAVMQTHIPVAKRLLEAGADVNDRSYRGGWTIVHEARNPEMLRLVLTYHPSLNTPSHEEKTPLHAVTASKAPDLMKILLESGADPNVPMVRGLTALHIAADAGWLEGVNLLLDFGALVDVPDLLLQETALHAAARNSHVHVIEQLCKRGANADLKNVDGMTFQDLLSRVKEDPHLWKTNKGGSSFAW